MSYSPREKALLELIAFQEKIAAAEPKFNDALGSAFVTAVRKSGIEMRVWFGNIGEMTLAHRSLDKIFKTPSSALRQLGVTAKGWTDDEDCVTTTLELSNGSAILLGLKEFENLTALKDRLGV